MKKEWIKNPEVFEVNRLTPKAFIKTYRNEDECKNKKTSLRRSLNGTWKFEYAESLDTCNDAFFKEDYDCSSWADIQVPGHLQTQGYGTLMYVNQTYPWSASEQILPGEIPSYNQIGSYVKEVELTSSDLKEDIQICFQGVESAFALWVNGTFIGYCEDSFTPSYFDLKDVVKEGINKIAVQVYRFSSGSWIEDQDFFRFSGIFRDVELVFIPVVHVSDLKVLTPLRDNYQQASVDIDVSMVGDFTDSTVSFLLYDHKKVVDSIEISANDAISVSFELNHPKLWSAEYPHLYQLMIVVKKEEKVIEISQQQVGIREFKMIDGLMCINGKRIVFHGVNRHEFSPKTGRVMTYEQTKKDLMIMKDNNINALRTSHYPNHTYVYDLCDELGLYCIDEVNLETHGTWQMHFDIEHIIPRDDMCWEPAILDRANSMVQRDKNHPSIIIWSLGNESFGGKVLYDESQFIRSLDSSRLIHYENLFQEELLLGYRSYPDTSDMESQMYTTAKDCEKYINEHPDKPFMLCEYAHSMGNSNGGLFKYIELEKKMNRYQGGFIWDFVDQAMYDKDGILRYGGDFRERPSDYDFCGNGIVFADREITPKMQEVKYCYQYVDMTINEKTISFKNNYLFTNLNEFKVTLTLNKNGECIEEKEITLDVEPDGTHTIDNPFSVPFDANQYDVIVRLFDAKKEVAHQQFVYPKEDTEYQVHKPVTIIEDFMDIGVRTEHTHVKFSKVKGMTSFKVDDEEMIRVMPRPNFFRAQTNNDVENRYGYRYAVWLTASLYGVCQFVKVEKASDCCKVYFDYALPNMKDKKVHTIYSIDGDGILTLDIDFMPSSEIIEMPAFGMMFNLYKEYDHVSYFGYGPDENYIDRNKGALLGKYEYKVLKNVTPYLYPQECGNRTNVQSIKIDNGKHAFIIEGDNFEFSAIPYTPFEMENAKHQDELPKPYQTVVCVYEKEMGVGGDDTWGACTLDEFLLSNKKRHHLRLRIKGE